MTRIELSVDCLKETFTVSGSLPEPDPQALSAVAVSRVARSSGAAVGRTGTTSYWPTSLVAELSAR
jgi:hypothetical protein